MSDSENRKVQDILREVADGFGTFSNICNAVSELRDALGVEETSSWVCDLASCLREIADRIDRQSVVEVQVPPQKTEYDGVTTELDALPMPAVIDLHDCFVTIHVYGGADDQD